MSFGPPFGQSRRATNKKEAFDFVRLLAEFLEISDLPTFDEVIESIVYLDNLGLTWVREENSQGKRDSQNFGEFSSFRTPLGNAVVKTIAPHNLFMEEYNIQHDKSWPENAINPKFRYSNSF